MPSAIDTAVGQLDAHLGIDSYRPDCCWTCALLFDSCPECDTAVTAMTADDLSTHRVVTSRVVTSRVVTSRTVGSWVVIGCEGYVTAALRSAATPVRP